MPSRRLASVPRGLRIEPSAVSAKGSRASSPGAKRSSSSPAPTRNWDGRTASISDFFNPWFGWRHSDWDDEFRDSHGDIFVSKVEQHLGTIYPAEKPWLALWFPLRCEAQANSANAAEEWIFQLLPGNDPEFYQALCSEFRSLVPSLVSLRSLQHIVIADRTANPYDSLVLNFPLQSQRIPSPDTTPGSLTPVTGKVNLRTRRSAGYSISVLRVCRSLT